MKSQFSHIIQNLNDLHHAYLLDGVYGVLIGDLHDFLETDIKFPVRANPDFWAGEFDTFGIDDSRKLKEMQSRKPVSGDRKIFIIGANFITTEAQNALLKVFEEPTAGTHFFIITPNISALLPTLISRCQIVLNINTQNPLQNNACKGQSFAKEFLNSGKAKRVEMLGQIIEEKDRNRAIEFLNNLEAELYNDTNTRMKTNDANIFKEIQKCRGYLKNRGASVKMILEHIALVLPIGKQ